MTTTASIGADLHRAMVVTVPVEELLIGRRRVRNWTQLHWQPMIQVVTPYYIKLVFVRKISLVLRKINKNCCHQSYTFLTPICTKSFVGCGFAPQPTGELTALPQTR